MGVANEVIRLTFARWPVLEPTGPVLLRLLADESAWADDSIQHLAELALARLCVAQTPPAITVFDSEFVSRVPEFVARLRQVSG